MKPFAPRGQSDERGVAALEFALVIPFFLVLMGVVVDFTSAMWSKGLLASSVAQGAQFAVLTGPAVRAADVRNVVQQKLALPAANVTVTEPGCFCVSGAPPATTAATCGTPCPNSKRPATYMTITATYTYPAVMPTYSQLVGRELVETTRLRLK